MPSALPGDPTRVLVAGDTHGNGGHWTHVLLSAARLHQVDGIVHVGDFGYWPLTRDGRDYLEELERKLSDDGRCRRIPSGAAARAAVARRESPWRQPLNAYILWSRYSDGYPSFI